MANSNKARVINGELLDDPNPKCLENSDKEYPQVFVGDEALPLKTNLIKRYLKHSRSNAKLPANYGTS